MEVSRRDLWAVIIAAAAFASLGSLSFVAAPVKFLAEGVPIADLLAVGRVTFRASLAVELALLSALVFVVPKKGRLPVCCAAALLLAQWLLLMPELDARTLARMAGTVPAPSSHHLWWIALDTGRLVAYALVIRMSVARVAARDPAVMPAPKSSEADTLGGSADPQD